MRDIKFRAWFNNKMYYNDFIIWSDGNTEFPEGGWDVSGNDMQLELMQYTGLKDKNGKEIYEGDIVTNEINDESTKTFNAKTYDYEYKKMKEIVKVEWDEFWCSWILTSSNTRGILEVIGNIYENPELINEAVK